MVSISYAFRIGKNTVSTIINETCKALWEALKPGTFIMPNQQCWLNIANEFQRKWQLPHCIGAIDGKHVVIQVLVSFGFFEKGAC